MQEVERLYELYGRRVYAYLLRLSGSQELATECTQETFCRLLTISNSYQQRSRVLTWLLGVARNVFLEETRRRRKHGEPTPGEVFEQIADLHADPAHQLVNAERRADIQKVMAQLPDVQREVLILKEEAGLSYAEIAEIVGQSANWVRVNCFRARARFRGLYEQEEVDSLE